MCRPGHIDSELRLAYEQAEFRVQGATNFTLRIGQPSSVASFVMALHGARTGAVITSDNPRSVVTPAEENTSRRRLLIEALRPYKTFPTEGVDPKGLWPVEYGYFILGISESEANTIACKFDQNVYVWVSARNKYTPELAFLGAGAL